MPAHWTRAALSPALESQKAVAAPKVGDRSVGFKQTVASRPNLAAYGVDFQKGVYDMTAVVIGPVGKVSISGAVHYAQIMAGRAH
jgi:hypothetical protein